MTGARNGGRLLAAVIIAVLTTTLLFAGGGLAHERQNGTETRVVTSSPTPSPTPTPSPMSTPSPSPGDCEPALAQARLHAPQTIVEASQHGSIAGGFQVPGTTDCPMVVAVTLSVPPGMTIAGASDAVSGGAGLTTVQFTVAPGEVRDVRAHVYSERTGTRTVTADITYWPQGQPESSREIDGISLTFDIREPNPAPEDAGADGSTWQISLRGLVPDGTPVVPIISIVAVALVGIAVARSRR